MCFLPLDVDPNVVLFNKIAEIPVDGVLSFGGWSYRRQWVVYNVSGSIARFGGLCKPDSAARQSVGVGFPGLRGCSKNIGERGWWLGCRDEPPGPENEEQTLSLITVDPDKSLKARNRLCPKS